MNQKINFLKSCIKEKHNYIRKNVIHNFKFEIVKQIKILL